MHQVNETNLFGFYNKRKNETPKENQVKYLFLKVNLLLFFLIQGIGSVKGQVATYDFQYDEVVYTPFTDGQLLGNDKNDDVPFEDIILGFDFVFNGNIYNRISISPNGYLSLENNSLLSTTPISNINNVISGFGVDLIGQKDSFNISKLTYKTIELEPNRVFITQWSFYKSKTGGTDNFNFQIKLFESSNRIEFIYGNVFHYWSSPDIHVQVGLRGGNGLDYNNRMTDSDDDWENTVEGNNKDATCLVFNLIPYSAGPHSGMRFTFTPSTGAQPIELYSFSGQFEKDIVKLKWATSMEINNAYFEIERSSNGVDFEVIGVEEGNGYSNHLIDYEFNDRFAWEDRYYYRLRQVDYNGENEYFQVIYVENNNAREKLSVGVYPNPSRNDNINFTINSPDKTSPVSVVLFSIEGKVLFSKTYQSNALSSAVALNKLPQLSPRTYYLKVTQGQYSAMEQIIIVP
ncbi:MAG TPA: T9SS type A sorting domain-containing protein [Cytophagales bacterium]|nr:T9SS type A sorting domain-containing protein [Cytophagales bacterium]